MAAKTLKAQLASKGLYDDSSGKVREQNILEGFLERLQLKHYSVETGERPDFMLCFDNQNAKANVGVEITEYYSDAGKRGSDQARFVQKWKAFAKALRQRLDSEGLPYLFGSIHFKDTGWKLLDGYDLNSFITEICEACKQAKDARVSTDDLHAFPILFKYVDHLFLRDTKPETGILWWPSHLQTGWLCDPREIFIQMVRSKSNRSYNWKQADEKWLLIYCASDGIMNTTGGYDDPRISENINNVAFDRVYVWNKFLESIDEIYPSYQNVFSATSKVLYRRYYPETVKAFITD